MKGKEMRNKWFFVLVAGLMMSLCFNSTALLAEEAKAPAAPAADAAKAPAANADKEKLAKESEEAAKASAKDKPTPEMIVKKVDEACKLLEKEGKDAFPKFKGKDSPFIFAGTYIWIHDMKGIMQVHPIKYKIEGTSVLTMKDSNGKLFFTEMNNVAREKGYGWISYLWPKPGEKESSKKISYVKYCKAGDLELVVGCGVYDISQEDIDSYMKSIGK
jgi:cytochrome c